MLNNTQTLTKVIIAGVDIADPRFDYSMSELEQLAVANQMEVVGRADQKLDHFQAGTYFGKGKVNEIKNLAATQHATHLIVNDELSPTQIRNLENDTKLTVIDRTELILEIFSNRAQTKQARLQVQLARLQYELPRLHPSENSLDQQRGMGVSAGGGGVANRGAGESKLELNRRTLEKQITFIKKELVGIEKSDETRRKERSRSGLPQVALVGYTNAGKSTTMNQLLEQFNLNADKKQVFEKDMLFATLDTSVRRIDLPNDQSFILSDTVGFVSKLPHKLIESFKATLQEAKDADLLIHVVDISDPNYLEMIQTTDHVLHEIGIDNVPTIIAYNKADKTDLDYPLITGNEIQYSAQDPKSIAALSKLITNKIFEQYQRLFLALPLTAGKHVSYLHEHAQIISEKYEADKITLEVVLSPSDAQRFQKYVVERVSN